MIRASDDPSAIGARTAFSTVVATLVVAVACSPDEPAGMLADESGDTSTDDGELLCDVHADEIAAMHDDLAGIVELASELWTSNPVWSAIGFAKNEPHAFKYRFRASNNGDPDDHGSCSFLVFASADFDGDLVRSVYYVQGFFYEDGFSTLEQTQDPCE